MTNDPWAEDAPIRRRHPGCLAFIGVLIVGALVVSFVITVFERVLVDIAVLAVIAAVVAGLVIFFRGPPDD